MKVFTFLVCLVSFLTGSASVKGAVWASLAETAFSVRGLFPGSLEMKDAGWVPPTLDLTGYPMYRVAPQRPRRPRTRCTARAVAPTHRTVRSPAPYAKQNRTTPGGRGRAWAGRESTFSKSQINEFCGKSKVAREPGVARPLHRWGRWAYERGRARTGCRAPQWAASAGAAGRHRAVAPAAAALGGVPDIRPRAGPFPSKPCTVSCIGVPTGCRPGLVGSFGPRLKAVWAGAALRGKPVAPGHTGPPWGCQARGTAGRPRPAAPRPDGFCGPLATGERRAERQGATARAADAAMVDAARASPPPRGP